MLLFLLALEVLAGPILPVVEALVLFEEELDEDEAIPGGRDLELDLEPTRLAEEPVIGECKDPEPTDPLIGDGVCLRWGWEWEWEWKEEGGGLLVLVVVVSLGGGGSYLIEELIAGIVELNEAKSE